MKCLDFGSSCRWLSDLGISVTRSRELVFPFNQSSVLVTAPDLPNPMTFLAEQLVEWTPKCSEYFVWFSDWQVAPATQVLLVNQLRTPCEGNHSLIERPGVLLDGASLHDMTSASAMIFLLMAFKWNGYLLSKCAKQSLYFFEGLIKASCDDDGPKQQFLEISQRFGLQVIGTSEPADSA